MRRGLIVDGLRAELKEAQDKGAAKTSAKSKCALLSKVLVHVRVLREQQPDLDELGELERDIVTNIQKTQLSDHLDNARRFEFKGQRSRALDRYYEALYLLRHDSISDVLQESQIAPIEAKIRELGGQVR
jgi:hypothetical protein